MQSIAISDLFVYSYQRKNYLSDRTKVIPKKIFSVALHSAPRCRLYPACELLYCKFNYIKLRHTQLTSYFTLNLYHFNKFMLPPENSFDTVSRFLLFFTLNLLYDGYVRSLQFLKHYWIQGEHDGFWHNIRFCFCKVCEMFRFCAFAFRVCKKHYFDPQKLFPQKINFYLKKR